ncbi:MAG: ABC transporter permease [Lachnospiraceae bacterium]|nr:ABC transporter permease [Lachnospiraceae bacterium]
MLRKMTSHKLFMPVFCLAMVLLVNVIMTPTFFQITIREGVFYGYMIDILNRGSELILITIGMTLVGASCGGVDISVGSVAAFSGALCCICLGDGAAYRMPLVAAFVLSLLLAALCGLFNGFLVAKLQIQPMVATLILYTAARGGAQLLTNGGVYTIKVPKFKSLAGAIPGIPLQIPIAIAFITFLIVFVILERTALKMSIEAVGMNRKAAKLVGIKTERIIFGCFVITAILAGIAGVISCARIGAADATNNNASIEMDAILAFALGGNLMSGGKFSLTGSLIGAITIQTLTTSLYALNVSAAQLPLYKALIVIVIVAIQSPGVQEMIARLKKKKEAERQVMAE